MRVLDTTEFDALLKDAPIKPRFKRDLKFRASIERLGDEQAWTETELLPVWNKSGNGGVLLIQLSDELYMVPFDATKSGTDSAGRSKPVICDLCYTWQTSTGGGFVTFYPDKSGDNSVSLLCCRDIRCSEHVRTKTPAALKSRTQLRESMTNDDRVARLRQKAAGFVDRLQLEALR